MSWVGYLLKDSELFILFAENSKILLKISVIPILLTFIYLVALKVSKQPTQLIVQLNSSLWDIIVTKEAWVTIDHIFVQMSTNSQKLHMNTEFYFY